jgi:hypothetical protein
MSFPSCYPISSSELHWCKKCAFKLPLFTKPVALKLPSKITERVSGKRPLISANLENFNNQTKKDLPSTTKNIREYFNGSRTKLAELIALLRIRHFTETQNP